MTKDQQYLKIEQESVKEILLYFSLCQPLTPPSSRISWYGREGGGGQLMKGMKGGGGHQDEEK